MKNLSPLHAESRVSWLAHTASACLIDEARLSPKPGLVDSRGNGAHQDLNLALMERSARSLQPTFHALAEQSWRRPADIALRETVGRLGREGEAQMMLATGGVNTLRGAIWALGLLVSAVAMLGGEGQSQAIADAAAGWIIARIRQDHRARGAGDSLSDAFGYAARPAAENKIFPRVPICLSQFCGLLLQYRAIGAGKNGRGGGARFIGPYVADH